MTHSLIESRRGIIVVVLLALACIALWSLKNAKLGLFPDVIKVSVSISYQLLNQDGTDFYHKKGKQIEKKLYNHKAIETVLADYSLGSVSYFVQFKSGIDREQAKRIAYSELNTMDLDLQPHRFQLAINQNNGSAFVFMLNNDRDLNATSLTQFKRLLESHSHIIGANSSAFQTEEARITIHHIPPRLALNYPSFIDNVSNSLNGQQLLNRKHNGHYDYLSNGRPYFSYARSDFNTIENRLLRTSVSLAVVPSEKSNQWFDKHGPISVFEVSFSADADPRVIKEHILKQLDTVFALSSTEFILDPSQFVEKAVTNVQNSLLLASIIVFAILLLVTRSLVNALVVSLCVCLTSVFSIAALVLLGFQLNLVVLSSLMIAIGVGVDAAIVVFNQMHRHAHYSSLYTIKKPLIGSLLTNIVVFTPILFFDQYEVSAFADIVIVFLLSCTLSFALSYWLLPVVLRPRKQSKIEGTDPALLSFASYQLARLGKTNFLFYTLIVFFIAAAAGLLITAKPNMTFFDPITKGPILMQFKSPSDKVSEAEVSKVQAAIKSALAKDLNFRMALQGKQFILLLPEEASAVTQPLKEAIKIALETNDIEIKHRVWLPTDFKMANPPEIVISFYDDVYEQFDAFSALSKTLSDHPPLQDIYKAPHNVSRKIGVLTPTPLAHASLELSTVEQLKQLAELIVSKRRVNQIQHNDSEIQVYTLADQQHIEQQSVVLKGQTLPLRYFINETYEQHPYFFWSKNGRKRASISIRKVNTDDTLDKKIAAIQSLLDQSGFTGVFEIEDGRKDIHRTIEQLCYAAVFALFLIYAITHFYFGTFSDAMIMTVALMLCVLFTLGLYLLVYNTISIATGMGIIILIGLGVNNFYLLYTRMQQTQNIQVVLVERIMPLLLTNATTVLCALPLTFTSGIESVLLKPIGLTLIIGTLVFFGFSLLLFPGIIHRFARRDQARVVDSKVLHYGLRSQQGC